MVICFEASIDAKNALDALLKTRQFRDLSEAVSMALINYEVIHRLTGQCGPLFVDRSTGIQHKDPPSANSAKQDDRQVLPTETRLSSFQVPQAFKRKEIGPDVIAAFAEPEVPSVEIKALSPKSWLWGHYNRFLPAKATCRALLNLSEAHPKGLPISEAATKISYDVCGLGDFLGDIDRRWNRQRDDALAAAFPTSGFNGDESRLRFGTQFVGALKQGKLTGLPAGLRFIVCDTSKDSRVTLTKAGAAFARLENPSLDFKPNVPISRLSKEEVRFLLDHIKCAVPEELAAYIAIIDGIEEGAKTPHELDKYLAQKFSLDLVSKAESPDQITETFLTSQRTGAVSRMVDLDLVFREKKGLHVTYVVTHPGKYFRSQMK